MSDPMDRLNGLMDAGQQAANQAAQQGMQWGVMAAQQEAIRQAQANAAMAAAQNMVYHNGHWWQWNGSEYVLVS